MKTLQRRIQQAAKDGGVNQLVVERDYAQSYVLPGIASQAELRETLVFKGGTALTRMDWPLVQEILPRKCAHRDVAIDSVADVFEPALLDEVRATWERTLGPFVPDLPDVDQVLAETRERLEAVLKL